MERVDGGVTYDLSVAFKVHSYFGVMGQIGSMSLSSTRSDGDEWAFPWYLTGVCVGNRVIFEALIGSVASSSAESEGDSSFAVEAGIRGEFGLWPYVAISPSIVITLSDGNEFPGQGGALRRHDRPAFRVPCLDE